MTYANLRNSILGNTGRDSRDTRSNHRRDDRGQSQYEEDRDGADALDQGRPFYLRHHVSRDRYLRSRIPTV